MSGLSVRVFSLLIFTTSFAFGDIVTDPVGDNSFLGGDFTRLEISNDGYNLYLNVAFASALNIGNSGLKLYIDADNDVSTGLSREGRGMDFSWDFDRNRGTSTLTSRGEIGRGNLIERISPSGTASQFEIAVSLEALPAVAAGDPVHLYLIDESSRDQIPDNGTTVAYTVSGPVSIQPLPIETSKHREALRIFSWNVLFDAAFEGTANQAAFLRVVMAMQPDIILLQEVYDTPTVEVLNLIRDNLQLRPGTEWHIARQNDCITISRFPIENSWSTDGNLVARILTAPEIGKNLLIGNAHLPCCSNESGRVSESLNMLSRIEAELTEEDAVIVGGDLNSGGFAPELVLLTTGQRSLEMASPRHLYAYDQYTWGSLGSSFGSSRLDFLLFDYGSLFREKAFILDTDLVPQSALDELSLEADDTFVSDHLPLILDIRSPNLPDIFDASPMAPDGSASSTWFGKFNGIEYPLIEQEQLGPIHIYESATGFWGYTSWNGWLWTTPDTWPWMWVPRPQ